MFEWALDGRFLTQRTHAPDPAPDSLAFVGLDADGKTWEHDFASAT